MIWKVMLCCAAVLPVIVSNRVTPQDTSVVCRQGDLTVFIECLRGAYKRNSAPVGCRIRGYSLIDGRRVLNFGDPTPNGQTSEGIAIESTAGAEVASPAPGFVLFAGEYRSFGPVLILDVGCGMDVVIAGNLVLKIESGVVVARDEPIATVSRGATPVVYYEIRENRWPINPDAEP